MHDLILREQTVENKLKIENSINKMIKSTDIRALRYLASRRKRNTESRMMHQCNPSNWKQMIWTSILCRLSKMKDSSPEHIGPLAFACSVTTGIRHARSVLWLRLVVASLRRKAHPTLGRIELASNSDILRIYVAQPTQRDNQNRQQNSS